MSRTFWLDFLTFGVPTLGIVVLAFMAKHPLMWAVAGTWAAIGIALLYWRNRK